MVPLSMLAISLPASSYAQRVSPYPFLTSFPSTVVSDANCGPSELANRSSADYFSLALPSSSVSERAIFTPLRLSLHFSSTSSAFLGFVNTVQQRYRTVLSVTPVYASGLHLHAFALSDHFSFELRLHRLAFYLRHWNFPFLEICGTVNRTACSFVFGM